MYIVKKGEEKLGTLSFHKQKFTMNFYCPDDKKDTDAIITLRKHLEKIVVNQTKKTDETDIPVKTELPESKKERNPDWIQKVLSTLAHLGYDVIEDHTGEFQLKMELPLYFGQKVLADFHASRPEENIPDKTRKLQEDIGRRLPSIIHDGAQRDLTVLAEQINSCISEDNYKQIDELLNLETIKIKSILTGYDLGKTFIETMFQIDANRLSQKKGRELRQMRVAYGIHDQDSRIMEDAKILLAHSEDDAAKFEYGLAIGCAYSFQHQYTAAIYTFLDLTKTCENAPPESQGWLYYDLAQTYYLKQEYEKGISAFLKAGDIWSSCGNENLAAKSYQNMAAGLDKTEHDQALTFVRNQIKWIDETMDNCTRLSKKEVLADWLYGQAQIYYKKSQIKEALESLDECAACADKIVGLEKTALLALKCKKQILLEINSDADALEEIDQRIESLLPYAHDPENVLDLKIENLLANGGLNESDILQLEQEMKHMENFRQEGKILILKATACLMDDTNKALAYLDEASHMELNDPEKTALWYAYSVAMRQKGDEEQEYQYLLKMLPLQHRGLMFEPGRIYELSKQYGTSEQRIQILQKVRKCWPEIKKTDLFLVDEQIGQGNYAQAYEILEELQEMVRKSQTDVDNIKTEDQNEELKSRKEAIKHFAAEVDAKMNQVLKAVMAKETGTSVKTVGKEIQTADFIQQKPDTEIASIRTLIRNLLLEFQHSIENGFVAKFWTGSGTKKKWVSHPEKKAQELLMIFLQSKLQHVTLLEEVPIDQGRMDILLQVPPCIKVIIELKMCGCGYPVEYTKHAAIQIAEYMKKMDAHIGFVLVMDGRKNQTQAFEKISQIEGIEVESICIQLAPNNPSNYKNRM